MEKYLPIIINVVLCVLGFVVGLGLGSGLNDVTFEYNPDDFAMSEDMANLMVDQQIVFTTYVKELSDVIETSDTITKVKYQIIGKKFDEEMKKLSDKVFEFKDTHFDSKGL